MDHYVNIATHAVTLECGRPLAPGDIAPVSMRSEHNISLREDGLLFKADPQPKRTSGGEHA